MKGSLRTVIDSVNYLVWHTDISSLPWWKAAGLWFARTIYAMLRDLTNGQLSLRAMSLVYTTLLSLVPLIAVSFSVLKAFGVHNQAEPILLNLVQPLGDQGVQIVQQIIGFVDNIKVGVLGSVGIALLFYTVISLVQKIESAFNYTWRVRTPRSLVSRLSNYLTVILIGPVLVFGAIGLAASLMNTELVQGLVALEPFGSLYRLTGMVLPYALVALAFTITYILIPNTRVSPAAALTGGVAAGLLWTVTGKLFATFVAQSAKYTAIYSGFAIVLLFMIWVYVSWLIVLIGASVAFYQQHPEYLAASSHESDLSLRLRERFALRVMTLIARSFENEESAWDLDTLAKKLNISGPAVSYLLDALEKGGLLVRTDTNPRTYLPSRPLEKIGVKRVLDVVRSANERVVPGTDADTGTANVDRLFDELDRAVEEALHGMTLKDLAVLEPATPTVASLVAYQNGKQDQDRVATEDE